MHETDARSRPLGFWTCTALIVGNTIGIGIFVIPAALAPYGLNAVTGWVGTIAGCVLLACVFAGLARAFPGDDGPYAYTKRALGEGPAFLVLWCYWVATCVTNAAIAIGIVGYLSIFLPILTEHRWLAAHVALSFVWTVVLINLRGMRTVGWMQIATTILKLAPQLAIIVLGAWLLLTSPEIYTANPPPNPASLKEVIAASTIALFAMLGIECAMVPASKVIDPARTIPRATIAGTLVVGFVYLCVSIVPMLLIPQAELAGADAPFANLFAKFLGAGYGELLAIFVIVSGLGALNGWTLMVGELTQNFAKHGRLPASLAVENAHASPARAFILTGFVASAMLIVNYNESMADAFVFLSVIVTAANLPLYAGCSLAVVVLWRRRVGRIGRRELMWFLAAALSMTYCIWVFIGIGARSLLWAIALGACGAPVYLWSVRSRRRALAQPVATALPSVSTRASPAAPAADGVCRRTAP